MNKKTKQGELVMHKLMGDHVSVAKKVCEICASIEGEQMVEKFEPITLGQKDVKALVEAIANISDRLRNLEQQIIMMGRDRSWQDIQKHAVGGGGGSANVPYVPPYKLEWNGTAGGAGMGSTTTKVVGNAYSSSAHLDKSQITTYAGKPKPYDHILDKLLSNRASQEK